MSELYAAFEGPRATERAEALVMRALERGQWGTLGDLAVGLSEQLARLCGARWAIAIHNGAQALELALRALNLGYGDRAVLPAYGAEQAAFAVARAGVTPVFADVTEGGGTLCARSARAALERGAQVRSGARAIVAVAVHGGVRDMDALTALSKERGVPLIVYAPHGAGFRWEGSAAKALGALAALDLGEMSLPGGGGAGCGGALVTDDEDIYDACWHYHNSGRTRSGGRSIGGHILMGTNARMSEWPAALLLDALERMPEALAARGRGLDALRAALHGQAALRLADSDARAEDVPGLCALRLVGADAARRDAYVRALKHRGVPALAAPAPLFGAPALSCEDFVRQTGKPAPCAREDFPNARAWAEQGVYLPGWVLAREEGVAGLGEALRSAVTDA